MSEFRGIPDAQGLLRGLHPRTGDIMTKYLLAAAAVAAIVSTPAFAGDVKSSGPVQMTDAQMDKVVAGIIVVDGHDGLHDVPLAALNGFLINQDQIGDPNQTALNHAAKPLRE
jgi:hypothetical protein